MRKIYLVLLLAFFITPYNVLAEDLTSSTETKLENSASQEEDTESLTNTKDPNEYYRIKLDQVTIAKGYTVAAFDDEIKLSLVPGILSESTDVEVAKLNEKLPMPWLVKRISHVYQFEFKNKAAYDNHKPYYIQFSYLEENRDYKQVFFYDKNFNGWRQLPTRDYPKEKFVRSLIHLPYARIAVFSYPGIMTSGKASWYAYKGGNFSASPDFPKGSKLRVYNEDDGKYVDVTINDWGPERDKFPNRAVDLDKLAFAQIAPLSAGVANVKAEPLHIIPDGRGRILGVPAQGVGIEPDISLRSAIVMNENTGDIIWEKNATTSLPLASLTKMVTAKVFLEINGSNDLNREISYLDKDEELNYNYCKPGESTKLRLNEGEVLTIEDALNTSLIKSANNVVETLVRNSGVTRDEFIKKMNETVKKWGAISTKFIEPTGLAPENVTTARDYAIITKHVLSDARLAQISAKTNYKFTSINSERLFYFRNTNRLVHTYRYPINGSKTGYLDEALYCLMTRVRADNGDNLIVITLGADTRDNSYFETEDLIRYGLNKTSFLK